MPRTNGTLPAAASAGNAAVPDLQRQAPRPARRARGRWIEPLELRAQAWHYEHLRGACRCPDRGYPCPDCQQHITALVALLRQVADDSIAATVNAWRRIGTAMIPRDAALRESLIRLACRAESDGPAAFGIDFRRRPAAPPGRTWRARSAGSTNTRSTRTPIRYPVLFRLGDFEITSFGVLVAIAALVGIGLFRQRVGEKPVAPGRGGCGNRGRLRRVTRREASVGRGISRRAAGDGPALQPRRIRLVRWPDRRDRHGTVDATTATSADRCGIGSSDAGIGCRPCHWPVGMLYGRGRLWTAQRPSVGGGVSRGITADGRSCSPDPTLRGDPAPWYRVGPHSLASSQRS